MIHQRGIGNIRIRRGVGGGWPERNSAGNAIGFNVQMLGLSFHDATRRITGT
jgi:hypothetical protein